MAFLVKQIEVDRPCGGCGETLVWAIPVGDAISALCANERCNKSRPFIDKAKYGHHWDLATNGKCRLDARFELSMFLREAVFVRDRHTCAHCGERLFVSDEKETAEVPQTFAALYQAASSQLELLPSAAIDSEQEDLDAEVGPPVRRKARRTIDHVIQRSITLALEKAQAISAEEFNLMAQYWVVASCLKCNSQRKIDGSGPMNRAAADVYVLSLMSLYQEHLIRAHAPDLLEGYSRFLRILGVVRQYLTEGNVNRVSA